MLVGIASKLTETLDAHDPVPWRPPYRTGQMAALLEGRWNAMLT